MSLMPTCYFRLLVLKPADGYGDPKTVLQQWWTNWAAREIHIPPEKCSGGQWLDVPIVDAPQQGKPAILPIGRDSQGRLGVSSADDDL